MLPMIPKGKRYLEKEEDRFGTMQKSAGLTFLKKVPPDQREPKSDNLSATSNFNNSLITFWSGLGPLGCVKYPLYQNNDYWKGLFIAIVGKKIFSVLCQPHWNKTSPCSTLWLSGLGCQTGKRLLGTGKSDRNRNWDSQGDKWVGEIYWWSIDSTKSRS